MSEFDANIGKSNTFELEEGNIFEIKCLYFFKKYAHGGRFQQHKISNDDTCSIKKLSLLKMCFRLIFVFQ